jgi:hypothetical protein
MFSLEGWMLLLEVSSPSLRFKKKKLFTNLSKIRIFSGPTPSNAPRNDVAPLKIITYRAIKTTGQ